MKQLVADHAVRVYVVFVVGATVGAGLAQCLR